MNKTTNFQSLSETEMELMKVIWKKNCPFKSNELLDIFSEKDWKGQTIATFLSRLVDKGLLSVIKEGRANIYTPCLSLQEYKQKQAQSLLDVMYQGSVNNFLSALYENKVTPDELDELQKWLSDK
ncbi:BlaI/MecI/CopY family transcriptional regulator [Lysinibacillus sp. NPDC086135]|uniref:BlaI/MecI/CopY family transcriptional regulator n=1 Tax=Lysinibacillus sp. NPDC086135 TaxID=3364130 RepID=UPI00382CDFF1